jgi:hypothetical protein
MSNDLDIPGIMLDNECVIILEKNCTKQSADFNDFDSVIFHISNLPGITKLIYKDYEYKLDFKSGLRIEINDQLLFESDECVMDDKTQSIKYVSVKLSSKEGIEYIRNFINECRSQYLEYKNNTLGDKLYYFDQININDPTFKKDVIVFTKKEFSSNKTFNNLFFEQRDEFVNRVKHFKNHKKWYDERGIPYTFTYGAFGESGCGKTSTMKAIATELDRHIINFKIDSNTTESQFKHLMFDEIIYVYNEDTTKIECCTVPIKKRLNILDDADAMNGIMTARNPNEFNPVRDNREEDHLDDIDEDYNDPVQMMKREMELEKQEEILEKKEHIDKNRLTLQAFLNILDGVLERSHSFLIIASQYFDKFDAAIIRRMDMVIHYRKTNRLIIKQMLDNFFSTIVELEKLKNIREYTIPHYRINQICFKMLYSDINDIISALEAESILDKSIKLSIKSPITPK